MSAQPARQDQRRMGAGEVPGVRAGTRISRNSRSSIRRRSAKPLELLGKKTFKATLQEKPIPGDTSAAAKDKPLPAYLEYQGDGDVTAPLVYVNYGMQDDYKALERMGVSVKGKIVIARYGAGWRGLKPRLAAGPRRGRLHHLFRSGR